MGQQVNVDEIQNSLRDLIGQKLKIDAEVLDKDKSVFEMGLDSLSAVEVMSDLETRHDIKIDVSAIWEFQTISELSSFICHGI